MACHDDGLDGAAAPGFGLARAEQFGAGCRRLGGRGDHEVVDLAGEAAGVVDRRRGGEGRDEEPGDLASVFADQADDLIAGDKAGKVGALLVLGADGRPPKQRLAS